LTAAGDLMIELDDVGLDYVVRGQTTRAVDGITLGVPRGASVGFVGPSGCGKSSLLKLISGLLPPTRGAVVVDRRRVSAPLKNVGMAFQNPVLLPWRTVLDNVMLPLEILKENRARLASDRALWEERARALLRTVGLAGSERRHPRELSGGMRQRASLCRALIHEPELLLLDEPFAALDAFTREEMWDLYQALRRERAFTGVLVTHDLREAVLLADTVYVLSTHPGRLAHVHPVPLPHPRTLAHGYAPETTALIATMREQIRKAQT
jgi:NitT/TauT family transport system ATP-binding protein